jgi:putative cell wall-binding protein
MGIAVNRIAGATRQATSLELAKAVYQLNGAPDTVIVASGYGFADALSIGPWAYASKTPILLTTAEGNLTEDEVSFIKSAGISKVIIVGGENAVSKAVEDQVGDIDLERLGGATRYDTSKLIAQWSLNHGMSLSEVCVVSGLNFPDALAGAALAGGRCGIMVLVNGDGGVCLDWVLENSSDLSKVQVLGGESAVSQSVYDCLLPSLN